MEKRKNVLEEYEAPTVKFITMLTEDIITSSNSGSGGGNFEF